MQHSFYGTPEVQVTALFFKDDKATQQLEAYPKRILYNGREYNFAELGMRYLVRKGQELVRLFDVSDGQFLFRLRLDAANNWTLVNKRTV